jgi:hypothetical protein
MLHEALSVHLGLTEHQRGRQLSFGETAIGPDNLAFAVPTRFELSDQERRRRSTRSLRPAAGRRRGRPGRA